MTNSTVRAELQNPTDLKTNAVRIGLWPLAAPSEGLFIFPPHAPLNRCRPSRLQGQVRSRAGHH